MQAKEIANELGLPPQFLTKILRRLTATDLVTSQRGRSGGFRLTRPPEEITMLEIIMPFEPQTTGLECVLGQSNCADKGSCPLHSPWAAIRSSLYDLLESTTLADVAHRAVRTGAHDGTNPDH